MAISTFQSRNHFRVNRDIRDKRQYTQFELRRKEIWLCTSSRTYSRLPVGSKLVKCAGLLALSKLCVASIVGVVHVVIFK